MIVEDNEKKMKLERDVLRSKGFRTIEAVTAEERFALTDIETDRRDVDMATTLVETRQP